MKRYFLLLIGCVIVASNVQAGDDAKKQTVAYLQKLQTPSGSFTTVAPAPNIRIAPTLRATSAGVRAIHYFGGEVPNKAKSVKFVESCYDAASGGFSDVPKGKPDVVATAVGLMAVNELKMAKEKYAGAATKYLSDNAKGFEEVRIAAAGLEPLKVKAPKAAEWIGKVLAQASTDGKGFGKGPGKARATASCVVTLLRLGQEDRYPDLTVKILDEGQRQNGGWGKIDDEIASDLETTYRVMRCYMMLKSQPKHAEGVRSFVAKCRNADGGYGVAPGQPSNVNGTYYAGSVLHWLK